ncbi:HupE/UreJ family protein [Marinibaculum pumilum]|uniref:HupE/UreJ family protein n=1 Tax=Marinibaculum pumilum TaxID=1766165 RepID=A0ABV7KUV5_9PROT
MSNRIHASRRPARLALSSAIGASVLLAPALAAAHTGHAAAAGAYATGFFSGFLHPLGGLDHLLAMVAVGLFAAILGGRALWLVPAAFLGTMVAGGLLALAGITLPFVELGIALSVLVLGLALAFRIRLATLGAMALVGFFALFHGHAHGAEMPAAASSLAYVGGFLLATALLHGAGMLVGGLAGLGVSRHVVHAHRVGGTAIAVLGAFMLAGMI